jgi:hypothetical protein
MFYPIGAIEEPACNPERLRGKPFIALRRRDIPNQTSHLPRVRRQMRRRRCTVTGPTTIPNSQPRFNVCPTGPVDTAVAHDGARELVEMRQPGVFHFN